MRFKSTDLMIGVFPEDKRFHAGLLLCGQATAGLEEEEEEEEECGQATAPPGDPDGFAPTEAGLALLRQQLHQTLALGEAASR